MIVLLIIYGIDILCGGFFIMSETVAKKSGYVFEMVKAVIIGLIISLAAILLTALLIKVLNIADGVIPIINQVIKGVSILVACLLCLRLPNNGWIRGIIVGILYVALSYVVFSLLAKNFEFGLFLLNDFAIGAVTGMISGVIASNIRK